MRVALLVLFARLSAAAVIYVDAAGADDGTSWADAYVDLQDALVAAVSGDEIWVAEGTYKPTSGTDRTISFALVDGVALYGGFAGTEAARDERYPAAHVTILSGDLNDDDDPTEPLDDPLRNNGENSYHVVVGANDATLDGFTLTGGNGNASYPYNRGGGMYNDNIAEVTVANCIFSGNAAGNRAGGMYSHNGSSFTVTDCTFSGNLSESGGGMYNSWSSPSIANCTFSGNTGDIYGGGLMNADSSATIANCTFSGNTTAFYGGGVRNWNSSSTFTNCRFLGNEARGGGGIQVVYSPPTIKNCIFSGNTAWQGAGMMNTFSSPVVANCTFSGNTATYGSAVYNGGSSPAVTNCVLWGNPAFAKGELSDDTDSSSTVTYTCIEGDWAGTGNVNADPLFADADGTDDTFGTPDDDLHLRAGSPCIDAADGNVAPGADIEGNARHDDSGMADAGTGVPTYVDMGAYEFQGATAGEALNVWNPPAGVLLPVGTGLEIRWLASGDVPAVKIELSRDGGASWEPVENSTANDRSYFWTVTDAGRPLPQPECRFRISDAADGSPSGTSGSFAIFEGICYVDADAPGPTRDGLSWATAFIGPQDALGAAWTGSEIRVAEATYKPTGGTDRSISFRLVRGVALYGGYAGYGQPDPDERDPAAHVTILSGDLNGDDDPAKPLDDPLRNNSENSYHVVMGASNAVLDGFTVTAGNADGEYYLHDSGAGLCNFSVTSLTVANCKFSGNAADDGGGGMSNSYSSLVVVNCTFSGNTASFWGGGLYNGESFLTVADCTFSGNSASDGGGMVTLDSSPTVTGCDFTGNTAYHGGGMGNWGGYPTVTDCTFSDNTADGGGGGMINVGSSPTITDCTFTNNTASYGGGISTDDSSPIVTNCEFLGNAANSGGGMDNDHVTGLVIADCRFSGNSATYGGGIRNWCSSLTVTTCTLAGNAADRGGGINDYKSSPTVTNCTLTGNTAGSYGGGMYSYETSSPTVTNCIFWGDSAPAEPEIRCDATSSCIVNYSDIGQVGGFTDGGGNINADPLVVDPGHWDDNGTPADTSDDFWVDGDYHLQTGSPCIDAADGDAAPPLDKDGLLRHDDPSVEPNTGVGAITYADMGAHEFNGSPTGMVTGTVFLEDGADPAFVTITAGGQTATKNVVGSTIEYTIYDVPGTTTEVSVETAEAGYAATGSPAPITWTGAGGSATDAAVTGHGTVAGTVLLEDGADPALVTITAGGQPATTSIVGETIDYTIDNVPLLTTGVEVSTTEANYTVLGSPAPITWTGTDGAAADAAVSPSGTVTGTVFLEDGADPAPVTIAAGGRAADKTAGAGVIDYTISNVSVLVTGVSVATAEVGYEVVDSPAAIVWVGDSGSAADVTVRRVPDFDGDGIPDWWEETYFSSIDDCGPGEDPDGDRLTNAEEYLEATNPLDPDSDDDGAPDGWEVAGGTNPLDPTDRRTGGCGSGAPSAGLAFGLLTLCLVLGRQRRIG